LTLMMMRRSIVAAVAAALLAAAPATAATTIGVVAPGTPQLGEGGVIGVSPGPAYTVPPGGGVITSWTVNGGTRTGTVPGGMALKLFRIGVDPAGSLTATMIGTSKIYYAPEGERTFPTRLPVSGGEQLGALFPAPGPLFASGQESRACSAPAEGKRGTTYVEGQTMSCESGRAVNIAAQVEPDDDEDGFGDETQDGCLGVRGRAAGCHSRYRGRGQGHPFELRFGWRDGGVALISPGPGRVVEDLRLRVTLRCPDGYAEELTIYGGIAKRFPVYTKPNGTFAFSRGMTPFGEVTGGRTKIQGRLTGPTARGTTSVALKYRHHDICKSGRYAWRIRSR
jgi:hypothetical protein